MATTREYLGYLDREIGIAPANSQEELDAANTIADLMREHDVETKVEEFDANSFARVIPAVLFILMFVGIILSGIEVGALPWLGLFLAVGPVVLFVLQHLGVAGDFLTAAGPRVRSQNVVAFHPATGPLVTKGKRPIVIVAHYDTPHESFIYSSPLGAYFPKVRKYVTWIVPAVGVFALFQVFGFIPEPFRKVLWVLGMICALPLLIEGADTIYQRFSACTFGANDNKSGVAAVLGVLEKVRPTERASFEDGLEEEVATDEGADLLDGADQGLENAEGRDADVTSQIGDQPTEVVAAVTEPQPEPVVGVRHGAAMIAQLGILPTSCEVTYVERNAEVRGEVIVDQAPAAPAPRTSRVSESPRTELVEEDEVIEETGARDLPRRGDRKGMSPEEGVRNAVHTIKDSLLGLFHRKPHESGASDETNAADAPAEPADEKVTLAVEETSETARPQWGLVMDDDSEGAVGDRDASGISKVDGDYDPQDTRAMPSEAPSAPAAPEDPEWGTSSYQPEISSVARRAALFDLPDPLKSSDPLDTDPAAPRTDPDATVVATSEVLDIETISHVEGDEAGSAEGLRPVGRGSSRSRSTRRHGDEGDRGGWKGGAAPRAGLRLVDDPVEGEELAEALEDGEDELRDALLGMGDDELISHDIWFVALGASDFGNAGMKAFLADHRREIRGAFLVNVECVGAGELNLLTREGAESPRRIDRRIARLLERTAGDLHVDLFSTDYDWTDTDATLAMRSSLRSATIMGLGENGLPAYSHTTADVYENLDAGQVSRVAELIAEMIRRS